MSADRRQNAYNAGGYKGQGMLNYAQGAQNPGSAQYLPRNLPMSPHFGENGMQGLAGNMNAMNIHGSYGSSGTTKSGASAMSGSSSEYNGLPVNWVPHNVMGTFQQLVPGGGQQQAGINGSPGVYNHNGTFMPGAPYHQYGQSVMEHSPMGWAGRVSNGDMPSLMTPRRDSISSNENDIPGTPFTGNRMYRYGAGATAIMDPSPNAVYTSSATPSPSQLSHFQLNGPLQKQQSVPTLPPNILALLHKDPPIPRAIPAPNSPGKPLDRSLENKTGETNVYIRGLLPETSDEMLIAWGKRFGDIQSSKSIIDLKTNLCKGFGFIKYHNFEDAENCIRGFYYLGYEVSFARESFYAKLKKFADENNTNLYVSNIPKNMNEHELGAIFAPHKVCSSKILRDPSGNGRGVGFARFDTRDICEDIIKKFNNTPVSKSGGEEYLIQIRYSDTQEQKMLKQQTAAGRVFRAQEYEVGVAQARGVGPDRYMTMSPEHQAAAHEFELFMQQGQVNGSSRMAAPYRQPWQPSVRSSLGNMLQASSGVNKVDQDGASEQGGDAKTDPTTPVKRETSSASPIRTPARGD